MPKITVHLEIDLDNETAEMTLSGGSTWGLIDPLIQSVHGRMVHGPEDYTVNAGSFRDAVEELFGDAKDYFLSSNYFFRKYPQKTPEL